VDSSPTLNVTASVTVVNKNNEKGKKVKRLRGQKVKRPRGKKEKR
jgi:hypothetical protein